MTEMHVSPRINGNRPIKKISPPVGPGAIRSSSGRVHTNEVLDGRRPSLILHVADPARAAASDNKPDQQG
jgi:hypothetical protein